MLHTETVARPTLELLKKIESENTMSGFNLAGGTALALYLGHRVSIDLDMFSQKPFSNTSLETFLHNKYGFRTDFMEKNTLKGSIDGIKIDCIAHQYNYLKKPYIENGIKLYSIEDITVMKLSAIADNGSRLKDFIDIAYLSAYFSLHSMLKLYECKFPDSNIIRILKSLTYFEDIDFDEDIIMLNCTYNWELIEQRLIEMSREQSKIFASYPLPKNQD